MKRTFFTITALLFLSLPLWAAHIIGGEITYDCLGNNNYFFTLKIYRDCAGGGADFDGAPNAPFPATVTIYQGNSTIPLNIVVLGSPTITALDPELSSPCLDLPPGICVEEGIYTFNLNLPQAPTSYHITYQRCCRNNTISNIVNPGDAGATYWMELTPQAQSFCNDSPTFNDFPPIAICVGEPLEFDFSATDNDGDELTYLLCAPFLGGGTNQVQPTQPNGVAPNPDLPPPYAQVQFVFPPYTANNPMGGNPPVTIDPTTGVISGVPANLGQFVVGVCVEERRNGELLSVLRRDFQFNVVECQPTVVADIAADSVIAGQEFLVISCGESTVQFTNQSYQTQNIETVLWEFDLGGGNMITSTDYDATITFPDIGTYSGFLILNQGTTCDDTARIQVNIFPEVTADFSFEYDTCIAGPVSFTDLSVSNAGPNALTEWDWSFGDGQTASVQDPDHVYMIPGNLPVTLEVTDINQCKDQQVIPINYFPVPALVILAPSEYVACQPASIFFNNLSFPIDETYDIVWDFGDGSQGFGVSPTHVYDEPGFYTVSLEITSPIGCFLDTVFTNLIEVRPSPVAAFSYSPDDPNNFEPTVNFFDESIDAISWLWDFNGIGGVTIPSPEYTFPDTGLQVVTQIVTHPSGCADTAVAVIDVEPQIRYFLPNAFTPDGDGLNDFFRGEGVMNGATDFSFRIWNRYGELIFETNDPFEAWNGRKNNIGQLAPGGVYIAVVSFNDPRGRPVQLSGYATLIR